jgi:hypothetical protein
VDILKVYPSGRVTASRRKRFNLEALPCQKELTEDQEWYLGQIKAHGIDIAIADKLAMESSLPLGLSSVSNLSTGSEPTTTKEKSRRGSNGISSFSRQRVKDAATLLEEKYGRKQLSFITHTIPDHAITYVHSNWTKILANLRRRYIRMLKKAGLPEELVMVSEYQEERFQKSGKAVLHLHILLVGRKRYGHWEYTKECYKECWEECCKEYSDECEEQYNWNAASRIESIRKSAANYLGKYMSKGVQAIADILAICPDAFIPPSWHILSQRLRMAVKKAIKHYEGKTASQIFEWLESHAKELLRFNRYIKIPTKDGRESCVGWYGDLKDRKLFNSVAVL